MPPESKKWIKPLQYGRSKGIMAGIDQNTWEYVLKAMKIPLDTPMEDLRITRYATKQGRIIIKVRLLKDIKAGEL